MAVHHARDLNHLARLLKRKDGQIKRDLERAAKKAAQKTAAHVRRTVPVAFSELRNSVHVDGSKVIADAPHAVFVERGTRPHWPPLEPILRWVKLRGFQALVGPKQVHRLPGNTTAYHAMTVGSAIEQHIEDGSVSVDVPVQIARAIQAMIAKRGTRPHWYMRNAVPVARGFLGVAIAEELRRGK